jgi:hypothetical protein
MRLADLADEAFTSFMDKIPLSPENAVRRSRIKRL